MTGRTIAAAVLLLGVPGAAAGCSMAATSGPAARPGVTRGPESSAGTGGTASGAGPAGSPHAVASRPAAPPRVWITFTRVRTADGSEVTLATFHGPAQFVLHDGSQDPGRLAGPVREGSKVTGTERARLLAAFNGGFKMGSHAGGYEQEGHVAKRLQWGLASLLIDPAGHARIGVWGGDVPARGERLYDVRQNLWLLVSAGQPTAQSARWWRWGGTIGNQEYVARSALGQDGAGNFIYAASMSTTPADLAQALARAGARVAMELDINPEWVQMDAATVPGGPLRARVPGQHRPATQYLTGWTRDFITVLVPAVP
jgi:hypothetical protein